MATKSIPDPAVGAAPEPTVLSPDEFVLELRQLMTRFSVPDLSKVGPRPLRRRLAHVDPKFLQAAINAVGSSTAVQAALGSTGEELRQNVDFAGRWTAAIDELRGMMRTFVMANVLQRQRLGLAALKTYKICQQLARDNDEDVKLAEHVREMKRLNKFGRARRRAPSEDPALEPAVKTP